MNKDETDVKLEKLFAVMSKNFFTHAFESLVNTKNDRSSNMAFFLAFGLALLMIIISGVEPVKLFFRRNFGSEGISTFKLVLSILAFGTISGISLNTYLDYSPSGFFGGNEDSFLNTAIIYAVLALFLLVKGINEKKSSNDTYQPIYRGDSTVLGFLIPAGLSQSKVQNLVEPLFLLIIGAACLTYNQLLGFPLIACSISYWFFLLGETLMGLGYARSILANKGHAYSENRKFSKAN